MDIQYVQLESAAFLTDIDFQMMDAECRGVYCSIILYLYCNRGSIELGDDESVTLLESPTTILAQISGCRRTGQEWEALWAKIAHKFSIDGVLLTHKRVTAELKRVADYQKAKSEAGKKGMKARWGDNTDITKVSKGKVSKGKTNTKRVFVAPTLEDVIRYVQANPELSHVDPTDFWKGYNDGGWIDTQGKPVRNWKLKLRTRSKYQSPDKPKRESAEELFARSYDARH